MRKIAANPGDHQEVAELVEIIKRDRGWNDDGARKQLLQFFDAWGAVDPATISARRKLSVLLFS
jgi:putative thioredoxin